MNTEIKEGCLYQGVFYPADEDTTYGFWHENTFLDLKSCTFDFTQLPATAQPCSFTKAHGLQTLESGVIPGFSYRGRFYRTTSEILQISMIRPLIYSAISSVRKSQCMNCKRFLADCMSVIGKQVCLDCLVKHFQSNSLYFENRDGRVYWTAKVIYEGYEELRKAGRSTEIPSQCPLPCDSILCYGRHEPIVDNYPSYGHIVGIDNQCVEGSCPTHTLCFQCADKYDICPTCGYQILYEQPPTKCQCGKDLCYGFAFECPACHIKPRRRKGNQGL